MDETIIAGDVRVDADAAREASAHRQNHAHRPGGRVVGSSKVSEEVVQSRAANDPTDDPQFLNN